MSDETPKVRFTGLRSFVRVSLPDRRTFEAPPGTSIGEVFKVAQPRAPHGNDQVGAVAAIVNGRLRELTTPLDVDCEAVPVFASESAGLHIYRRSLSFLLLTAAGEIFPEAVLLIQHAAPTLGGYYCQVRGRQPFSQAELELIEARMREIVAADEPISKETVPVAQAIAIFTERGETDTVRLLSHREKGTVRLYGLRGRQDYFQGYMVPSAGCLKHFALHAFPPGFMLQFPHQNRPGRIGDVTPYPRLFSVFEEAGDWLDRLGIRSAGALNDAIAAGRLPEVSLVAEALHESRIASIAAEIARQRDRVRVVLIAGPSSSGKTTFSKRLAVQLLAQGVRPFPVCLDDYFVERHKTPRDQSGQLDYECLLALDIGLFNEQLLALIAGRPVAIPHYNFKTGLRETGPNVMLGKDDVIIVEGIHGLNPALVPGLPADRLYRLYVSALTQLNLDRHNRVSTTDSRLIRRLVRDAATRGYTAADTLQRWEAVTRSERQLIFPFQEMSDAIFNSALVHELAILRPFAEPLLLQVRPGRPEYLEANRLLSFLQWFRSAPPDPVPDNSILREFIGGSVLETFRLWPETRDDGPDPLVR
ncbi:MAG: nucleoside kinase [Vicinamibacterales bacterium]